MTKIKLTRAEHCLLLALLRHVNIRTNSLEEPALLVYNRMRVAMPNWHEVRVDFTKKGNLVTNDVGFIMALLGKVGCSTTANNMFDRLLQIIDWATYRAEHRDKIIGDAQEKPLA